MPCAESSRREPAAAADPTYSRPKTCPSSPPRLVARCCAANAPPRARLHPRAGPARAAVLPHSVSARTMHGEADELSLSSPKLAAVQMGGGRRVAMGRGVGLARRWCGRLGLLSPKAAPLGLRARPLGLQAHPPGLTLPLAFSLPLGLARPSGLGRGLEPMVCNRPNVNAPPPRQTHLWARQIHPRVPRQPHWKVGRSSSQSALSERPGRWNGRVEKGAGAR